jgi:hypothetical protein
MRKIEPRLTQQEFEECRESYERKEITEEYLKKLVILGRLTPPQYGVITRKVYSMYKDVRRDLIED